MQKLFFIILFLLFIFFVNNAISRNKYQDTQNIQPAITDNNISTERNTTTSQVQKQESNAHLNLKCNLVFKKLYQNLL